MSELRAPMRRTREPIRALDPETVNRNAERFFRKIFNWETPLGKYAVKTEGKMGNRRVISSR